MGGEIEQDSEDRPRIEIFATIRPDVGSVVEGSFQVGRTQPFLAAYPSVRYPTPSTIGYEFLGLTSRVYKYVYAVVL